MSGDTRITGPATTPLTPIPIELFAQHMVSIYALNIQEVGRLGRVSKLFNQAFSGEGFWQFIHQLDHERPKRNNETWLQAYRREHLLRSNLLNQVYSYKFIGTNPSPPDNNGLPLITAIPGKVISGCFEYETKMWDMQEEEASFLGDGPSTFVEADQKEVFMGKNDGSIEIFDLTTGQLRFVKAHDGPVYGLAMQPHRYFTSSGSSIKIWDRATDKFDEITRQDETFEWLCVEGDILASVNHWCDHCILWDLKTREPILDYKCKTITSLVLSEGMLVLGTIDGFVTFYNIARKEINPVEVHLDKEVQALLAIDGLLFSGAGWELAVSDLKTGLHLISTPFPMTIISLAYSEGVLFISDDQGKVHALDYEASDEQVFKEIVLQLRSGEESKTQEALDRYSRMPKFARKAINETFKSIQYAQKYFMITMDHELRARAIERHLVLRKEEKEAKPIRSISRA